MAAVLLGYAQGPGGTALVPVLPVHPGLFRRDVPGRWHGHPPSCSLPLVSLWMGPAPGMGQDWGFPGFLGSGHCCLLSHLAPRSLTGLPLCPTDLISEATASFGRFLPEWSGGEGQPRGLSCRVAFSGCGKAFPSWCLLAPSGMLCLEESWSSSPTRLWAPAAPGAQALLQSQLSLPAVQPCVPAPGPQGPQV